jgi:hypothetical protein
LFNELLLFFFPFYIVFKKKWYYIK